MEERIDPAELVALALDLENEGQYNTAKLLRAAATSIVNRRAHGLEVPSDPEAQARMLERMGREFQSSRLASLSGPLAAAASALRAGGVALAHQAPDPYVCRVCGELMESGLDTRCAGCGRWPTSFERIRPVYWLRETAPAESLSRLRENLAAVESIASESSDMLRPGPDGGWSAHQVVEHLHNAQTVFRGRIDQLVAGGDPELRSVQVWTIAPGETPTDVLVDAYVRLRRDILDVLSTVDPSAWDNRGFHEEWGWVTLAEQASYFANHEPTHLGQLADAADRPG